MSRTPYSIRHWLILTLVFVSLIFATVVTQAQIPSKQVPESNVQIQLSFAPLVRKAAPGVVNIFTRKRIQARRRIALFDDPFFKRFFGNQFSGRLNPRKRQQNALGSGVIVTAEGLVITNNHVIEGADEIKVVLADRREFSAKVVVADERTDLAVLQLQTKGVSLPFVELRDSDELEIGDLVLAIGNPFGVGQTVTSGIVSALARTKIGSSDLNFFIQTDAAINPGNSGGALVSMDGKLVGINTAIYSKSGGSLGIGFATPSTMVSAILKSISKDGKLVRSWLGATGQTVTQDIANNLGLERPVGVLINRIHRFGSGAKSGLKIGDVILAVNGREVNDSNSLGFRIATLAPGETGTLDIWRRKRVVPLQVVLKPAPRQPSPETSALKGRQPIAGAVVANMSPKLAEEMGLDPYLEGVTILKVARGSTAARLGFRPGDIIKSINQYSPMTVRDLFRILEEVKDRWAIEIERDGKRLNMTVDG